MRTGLGAITGFSRLRVEKGGGVLRRGTPAS